MTSRSERGEHSYENDADRRRFVSLPARVCITCNWICRANCLMGNHYHLLLQTAEANLPTAMRQLNGVYAQQTNRPNKRRGH